MSQDKEYADYRVMVATSYLLQRDIKVVTQSGINLIEAHPSPKPTPLLIGWRPEHFYSLQERE